MSDFKWGTSPEGEGEAARKAAERQKEFQRELDKVIEHELGIKPRSERNGVSLEKDETARQMYTGNPPRQPVERSAPEKEVPDRQAQVTRAAYDSEARRQALQAHLERIGIPPELRAIRDLVERGQAKPPTAALEPPDRRDPDSKGAGMRTRDRDERERGISRGD